MEDKTANKQTGDPTCIQQTEGKTYRFKFQEVERRSEPCENINPICEQGPFAADEYVPRSGSTNEVLPGYVAPWGEEGAEEEIAEEEIAEDEVAEDEVPP